jgi:hypothetical protein
VVSCPEPTVEPDFSQTLTKDLQLTEFLSRPVQIYSASWAENSFFSPGVLDPFKLLLANTAIKNKLTGYRYFRANMRLTITVSASPFLYSALQVAYSPMDDGAGTSYGYPIDTAASTLNTLLRSNSPLSGFLYPQDGKPLVMDIPFIYPLDWFVLTVAQPVFFGSLKMFSPVTLRSAGPTSLSTCTVTVIAQFINPELCGLTASAPQSGTFAGASKDLSRAGFGSASAWANVASKALKLVGLSNPATVAPAVPVVNKLFSDISNVDRPVYAETFAMGAATHLLSDPHNGGDDELDIAAICAKPSTIGFFPWTTTGVVGDSIFRTYVSPSNAITETIAGTYASSYEEVAFTNAAYVSTFFRKWRGTMCYRFKPIVSQFHRGKLRVFYDSGNLSTAPAEGVLSSEIIDLSDVQELVLRIPMNASTPWLSVPLWLQGGSAAMPTTFGTSAIGATFDATVFSGTVRVQIMQALTSPAALGSATIQVDCWFEDAQFADPCHWTVTGGSSISTISPSAWQSGEDLVKPPLIVPPAPVVVVADPPQSGDNVIAGERIVTHDGSGVITKGRATSTCIGEDVLSLRALMHRSSYYRPISARYDQVSSITSLAQPINVVSVVPRFPRSYGSENRLACEPIADLVRPRQTLETPVLLFNFVNDVPLVRLSAMFLGYKGSIRWRFSTPSVDEKKYPDSLSVIRTNYPPGRYIVGSDRASSSIAAYNGLSYVADSLSGLVVSNLDNSSITVDAPDYTVVKFLPTNQNLSLSSNYFIAVTQGSVGNTDCIELRARLRVSAATDLSSPPSSVDAFVSACPDMRLIQFIGPPKCYRTYSPYTVSPWPHEEGAP